LPNLNQSQVNPKADLAAWAGRHGPKASPLITLLTITIARIRGTESGRIPDAKTGPKVREQLY